RGTWASLGLGLRPSKRAGTTCSACGGRRVSDARVVMAINTGRCARSCWSAASADTKRQHRSIGEDRAWLFTSGRVESFAAENDLHHRPQATDSQDLSFFGQWIGGAWMPNFDSPIRSQAISITHQLEPDHYHATHKCHLVPNQQPGQIGPVVLRLHHENLESH